MDLLGGAFRDVGSIFLRHLTRDAPGGALVFSTALPYRYFSCGPGTVCLHSANRDWLLIVSPCYIEGFQWDQGKELSRGAIKANVFGGGVIYFDSFLFFCTTCKIFFSGHHHSCRKLLIVWTVYLKLIATNFTCLQKRHFYFTQRAYATDDQSLRPLILHW